MALAGRAGEGLTACPKGGWGTPSFGSSRVGRRRDAYSLPGWLAFPVGRVHPADYLVGRCEAVAILARFLYMRPILGHAQRMTHGASSSWGLEVMSEIVRNLVATILGSTILTTLITDFLAKRRERRSSHRARIEELTKLYEGVLSLLDYGRRQRCRGDASLEERLININARLDLMAPEDIRSQFRKAGWALQEWAALANRAEPEPTGEHVLIRSGMQEVQKEADRRYPAVEEEIEKLKSLMREHLSRLELTCQGV